MINDNTSKAYATCKPSPSGHINHWISNQNFEKKHKQEQTEAEKATMTKIHEEMSTQLSLNPVNQLCQKKKNASIYYAGNISPPAFLIILVHYMFDK